MWAHHPSAWTAPTKKAEPQFVVVEDKKRKKLSKRRKIIIQMTIDRLTSLSDEHISIYTKFAKRWYLDRDEAINMIENVNFPLAVLRPSVWELCSRSCELLYKSPGVYKNLLSSQANDESLLENILLDIERTLPCMDNFDQEKVKSMKNILIAYSVKDKVIGYSQGMNYLAASIIFQLPEESAFWLLMRLMKGYSLEKLYPSPLSELNECLNKLEILLNIYMPDIQKQLQNLGAELHYYVPQWFQTIFLYTQRVDLSIRVLDLLIVHGIQALFRVGLSIFALAREALLSPDMTLVVAIDILKNLNLSILTTKDIILGSYEYPNNLLLQTMNNNENGDAPSNNDSECVIS